MSNQIKPDVLKTDVENGISWKSDPAHSSIQFNVRHMMFATVQGVFNEFDASLLQQGEDFSDSVIEAIIKTDSINTNNEDRDNHLRSADFFDVEQYPQATFTSSSFKQISDDRYMVKGELNLHGVTKQLELDATYLGMGKDPWGNDRIGFNATTKLNRYDFGLEWNQTLETGGILVGKEIELTIDIQFVKEN